MPGAVSKRIIRVRLCPIHHPRQPFTGAYLEVDIKGKQTIASIRDFINHALTEQWQYGRKIFHASNDHEINFHVEDQCLVGQPFLTASQLRAQLYRHDETKNPEPPVIEMHVREAEHFPFRVEPKSKHEDIYEEESCQTVRVGHCPGRKDVRKGAIDMEIVVVAIVHFDKNLELEYHAIDSWEINGDDVGDYTAPKRFKDPYEIDDFVPDPYFKDAYAKKVMSEESVYYLNREMCRKTWPKFKSTVTSANSRPIAEPIMYAYAEDPLVGPEQLKEELHGKINAVVNIVNEVSEVDLGTRRNLQASLDFEESFQDFEKWVLGRKVRPEFETGAQDYTTMDYMLNDPSSRFGNWAKLDIWVVPQEQDELYQWTDKFASDGGNMLAKDFLDEDMIEKHGRKLYIQVRIVSDPDGPEKNKSWKKERRKSGVQGWVEDHRVKQRVSQEEIPQEHQSELSSTASDE